MPRPYHMEPQRLARLIVAEPQINLRALVTGTDPVDRRNSATVRLRFLREFKPPRTLRRYRMLKGVTLTAENAHQHETRIFCDAEDWPIRANSRVLVDCTCGRYTFSYEYANAMYGVGFIYRSNGEPPDTSNPSCTNGCCKHLYRLLLYLLRTIGARARNAQA